MAKRGTAAKRPGPPVPRGVRQITEVRSEYTSARLILANLDHRAAGRRWIRSAGYIPAEIDYRTVGGEPRTISIRDYDVRSLDRVPPPRALEHLNLIHLARNGNGRAARELARRTAEIHEPVRTRFAGTSLAENEHVVPYTTPLRHAEAKVSHKGASLIELTRLGVATADFTILASTCYGLRSREREEHLAEAIRDLEILSGRKYEDPRNPLLLALRSAMPFYVPGFMPTYLNVGVTPALLPGLVRRYGEAGTARILLNNRKTILEALDPEAFRRVENDVRPGLDIGQALALARRIEGLVAGRAAGLLEDAAAQARFFLARIYDYYESHLDVLRNFMAQGLLFPSVIVQRMVCSAIDDRSYAGVLYSRHPRLGGGVFLQFARAVFGEDLMTGRMPPEERHFARREEARRDFPAVYHVWDRLAQLETIFDGPVMVEFTGVHGTFTTLQVNAAELTGTGMLTAVMDLYRAGRITAERVRELVKPYHVRQIESDAIDPKSLHALTPFCRGLSVLPRSAVTGRVYFSAAAAKSAREAQPGEHAVLVKERFTPTDVIDMQSASGICSLSPAAIHVVTSAQNLGVPVLLNLEEAGVRLDPAERTLVNRDGLVIREGDWVSISSRLRTLYAGRALFAPARLLRFMAGEAVPLTPAERPRFEALAAYYREFRAILEGVEAARFESLQDLGHAIQYGRLQDDPRREEFVNRAYDANRARMAERLLDVTLGSHYINLAAYRLLTPERRVDLLKSALAAARERGLTGYQAGAFVIGSLVELDAGAAYWGSFEPAEIAALINEWLLHQKYLRVLDAVGERRVNRARSLILAQGLSAVLIHRGWAVDFKGLRSSGIDLAEVRRHIGAAFDPQMGELLDVLEAADRSPDRD
jgi:hypothetical protein